MITRAALGLSLPIMLTLTVSAHAAEDLSIKTLSARLEAKPTGQDAEALANDVRAWFGKNRAGASPKIDQLLTAWAVEGPDANSAAVALVGGKSLPLTRIGDTPVFAGVFPLSHGAAYRY